MFKQRSLKLETIEYFSLHFNAWPTRKSFFMRKYHVHAVYFRSENEIEGVFTFEL